MRNLLLVAGLAGVVATAACGDTDRNPVASGDGGGTAGKTGKVSNAGKSGSNTDQGGAGGDGPAMRDPLAPIVTITSPAAVDDPNQEGVLSGSEVEVVCTAKQSSEPNATDVDGTSVKVQLLDAEGELVEEKAGNPTDNVDEYANTFIITDSPAGELGFRCTAKTKEGNYTGEDEISTLVDKGPLITFLSPAPDASHPLEEKLAIKFTVEAAPIADGDEGAEVDSATVSLRVAGQPIDLTGMELSAGEYHVEVDFTEPKFTPAPNGPISLTAEAANNRKPAGVVAATSQVLVIDGAPPTIEILNPPALTVVGQRVTLEFRVSDDASGADPDSVVVTINDKEYPFNRNDDRWGEDNGLFKFEFDSLIIEGSIVQATVSIAATDRVGNSSESEERLLYLDHYAPLVDLDPEFVRLITRRDPPQEDLCSVAMDPVGPFALNDYAMPPSGVGGRMRALVWERTNYLPGFVQHFSGTDKESVRIFAQHPNDGPLLIDRDENGVGPCEEVADPMSDASLNILPIFRKGIPSYSLDEVTSPSTASLACVPATSPGAAPKLCNGFSDMDYVIEQSVGTSEGGPAPAIFAPEGEAPGALCTGGEWEFASKVSADGWVCVVARALDAAGNIGVSAPLRVCIDSPSRPGTPDCSPNLAPSCTNGCTLPPQWETSGIIIQ